MATRKTREGHKVRQRGQRTGGVEEKDAWPQGEGHRVRQSTAQGHEGTAFASAARGQQDGTRRSRVRKAYSPKDSRSRHRTGGHQEDKRTTRGQREKDTEVCRAQRKDMRRTQGSQGQEEANHTRASGARPETVASVFFPKREPQQ